MLYLTYVDSPTEALHEKQDKYMKRNKVDDEHVTAPSWNLWNKQTHSEYLIRSFSYQFRALAITVIDGGV